MDQVVTFFLLAGLALGGQCLIPDFLKNDLFSIYRHSAITSRELKGRDVTPEEVTFYLFTKENSTIPEKIDLNNLEKLAGHKIVFFIHGWTNSREAKWYDDLKNAFFVSYPEYYVVQVDWKEPAAQYYYVSSINTYDVAKIITNMTLALHNDYRVPLENLLFIGHSLGGQTSGFVGKLIQKELGKKLPRIIALDPAGPLFDVRPEDKRLNKDDAEIVEVVHTDGGTFGYEKPLGTIDFYVNGGSSQPGCKKIDLTDIKSVSELVMCDHRRAYEYFAEAILNPEEFVARSCSTWKDYEDEKCNNREQVRLGDINLKASGKFFLVTNGERPFARSENEKRTGLLPKLVRVLQPHF